MSVIANTTVVSGFASIGQLDVLRRLFGHLHISTEVYQEIRAGLAEGYLFYEGIADLVYPLSAKGWILLTSLEGDDELRLFAQLPAHLHAGEASSIAIASHRDWAFLTDDQAARKAGQELGLRLSGTLGCLLLAIEKKLCSVEEANGWLLELIDQGYRSPVGDLRQLLRA